MKHPLFLIYTVLLIGGLNHGAYAQVEVSDSTDLSPAAKVAASDGIFFDALKAKMKDDKTQAIHLLDEYIAKRPEISAAYYERARLYHADKQLDKADADLQKAMQLDKDNKWYQEEKIGLLADESKYGEAAGIAAELGKKYPDDPSYPLMAAEFYERSQQYKEAINWLDKALVRNPDEDITLHKVQLYLNLNELDKATGTVEQLIAHDPRNGKYYKLLGELYDNNKQPAKAADVYERARKALPDDASIQLGLAEHYLKAGDTVAYKTYLRQAIVNKDIDANAQIDFLKAYVQTMPDEATSVKEGLPLIRELVNQHPDDANILSYFGDFLDAAGQRDSAIQVYKKTLDIKPSAFATWRSLLSLYTEKQYADSLVRYSEKFIRLFPTQAIGSYYNGIGYLNKKDYAKAAHAVNRAIDMQSDNDKQILAVMYSTLGDIYNSGKQYEQSDVAFDKAMNLSPDDPTLLNNYSYYLSVRGQKLDEAEKMSKRSIELRPSEATYMDTYGWILYKKGDLRQAGEYVQKAIDMSGGNADGTLYNHLGDIYYKQNDKDKAIQNWKKAKEKGDEDPLLDKKISEGKLYE